MAEERPRDAYNLDFAQRGDCLHVQVFCNTSAQTVRIAYWQEIAREAMTRGMRKLLVTDRRDCEPGTPAELAELVVLFQHEAIHFDRIAVIEPTPEFLPMAQHGEIFGQSLGFNVRVFSAPAEAERWLRYGSPDD